jgi:hypothetical protein
MNGKSITKKSAYLCNSMKKILFAILTILYMSITSGIAMDIHYCMGKEIGFDLYGNDNDVCNKCGMKHKKGCCGDEHKFYKLSDSHKNVSNDINLSTAVVAIVTNYSFYNSRPIAAIAKKTIANNSPPGNNKPALRILNGVFRI